MKDLTLSWIRTNLPLAWSLLIAWGVGHGLPASVATWAGGFGGQLTDLVIAAVLYGLARYVEPHLPNWLTSIFFGSGKTPTYPPVPVTSGAHAIDKVPPAPSDPAEQS